MSLKINNETITSSELSGENEDLTYFNTSLTPLVPNSNVKLLGSPSQREQLKRMASGNIPYVLNYTPKITNIVNPGDNTNLSNEITEIHEIISDFSTNPASYLLLDQYFKPQNNSWELGFSFTTGNVTTDQSPFTPANNSYDGINLWINTQGYFVFQLFYDNNNGKILEHQFSVSANTKYWVKLIYNSNTATYTSYYCTEGSDYTPVDSTSSDKILYQPDIVYNIGTARTYNRPFLGSIDFTSFYIKINDTYFFNGATAVEGTDYTIEGNPTITEEEIPTPILNPFTFSFDLDSSTFTRGTKLLLEHPNLIKVKTENNILYFNFSWKSGKWYYLSDNILVEGINSISLEAPEALLQIPYYAYTYNNDSVYTKTLSLSTRKNSSVQGSLTIDGSNYSGFSSSNYIQTINFDPQDKPWEIVIKAKFNSSGQVGFCATKSQRAWNTYWNGNGVNVELSSNNGGWDIGSISHTTTFVSDNTTWYWMKFEFTGSQYIYSVKSQNDADYIVQGNPITSSTPIYTNGHAVPLTLGIDNGGSAMPAATIDLSGCYFKIGNKVTNLNSTILLSSLYDSQFQKLTYEQSPEVLNNNIIIDNNTYVRTQANDLTQTFNYADNIKLIVNNHNFTLTDSDLPAITTGVLGYREELEF